MCMCTHVCVYVKNTNNPPPTSNPLSLRKYQPFTSTVEYCPSRLDKREMLVMKDQLLYVVEHKCLQMINKSMKIACTCEILCSI